MSSSPISYRFRFPVLLSFCLVNAGNAIMWISFAPINSLSQGFFSVDAMSINALSICFLALYLPGTILSLLFFNRFSLRTGFLFGAALTALAGWIRFASAFQPSFPGVLFGQCLAALAQPFFTNIPAKVASRWFPVPERDLATVVGTMFNPIGIAVGTLVSTEFVKTGGSAIIAAGMQDWLLFQALFSSIALVLAALMFRDRPPTPASISQESTVFALEKDRESGAWEALLRAWRDVVSCLRHPSFLALLVAFGVGLGIFNSLTTLVEQITRPSCATVEDASTFGGLLIGLGLVGAVLTGVWLDRSHKYRFALRLGFGAGLVFTLGLTLAMQPGQIDAIAAMFALLGLFMLPMLPVAFSAAAEATFPVPEDVSSGLLMLAGQLTGIAFIFGLGELIPNPTPAELAVICTPGGDAGFTYPPSSILLLVCIAAAFGSVCFFQDSNNRLAVDQRNATAVVVNAGHQEADNPN